MSFWFLNFWFLGFWFSRFSSAGRGSFRLRIIEIIPLICLLFLPFFFIDYLGLVINWFIIGYFLILNLIGWIKQVRITRQVLLPNLILDFLTSSIPFLSFKYAYFLYGLSHFIWKWSIANICTWSSWKCLAFIRSTCLCWMVSIWLARTGISCWITDNVFEIFLIMNFHYIWKAGYFFFRNSIKKIHSLNIDPLKWSSLG